ncbi:MAG: dihydropteroate synthase-like protein [Candidatus Syntropharchaeia archaeon]
MRILAVTGRKAEKIVKKACEGFADVEVLDIDIAAFITPELLRSSVKNFSYDLILIPGLITADFSEVEEEIGIPIRLGPKHAYDLSYILPNADEIPFSKKKPACELFMSKKREKAFKFFSELERNAKPAFTLRGVKIGGESCMKVCGEIVDGTKMGEKDLIRMVREFEEKGADIVDIGVSMDSTPEDVKNAVKIARSASDLPISVDSLNPELLLAGIESGADMILSLNSSNLESLKKNIGDFDGASVIISDDGSVESLLKNIERAKEIGMEKIIADPILSPVGEGFVNSVHNYYLFRSRNRETPLFFGAGNVTELIDADSIGVNALLAGIASELGASVLFTPEYSDKAKGSIKELKTASEMMFIARKRKTPPKDLGIDLLVIKEKRRRMGRSVSGKVVFARRKKGWKCDPKGCFSIGIENGRIYAKNEKEGIKIVGKSAKEIFDTIESLGLVSLLDHAGYLGRELMKAELALKFGRSYVQDDEF